MLETIRNIFKVEELRSRILFTLALLIVFRIGTHIPVPNTDATALKQLMEQAAGVFGIINAFSGNALSNFSIFAMGIMPYITASIIVQLLTMEVIPSFARWAKEGEVGRRKLSQVTRYITIVLAIIQSIILSIGFDRFTSNFGSSFIKGTGFWTYALIAITLTAGTAFLMWMGEQITEKGIGNGISILIFAGIITGIPTGLAQLYEVWFVKAEQPFLSVIKVLILFVVVTLVVIGIIYMQQGMRKIPVQYTKRVVGRKMYGGQSTHIPFKINSAGVIPVIFAISLIMFPPTIASYWKGKPFADWIIDAFSLDKIGFGTVMYVLLIIGFTYFYTFVQLNPEELSKQMKKNGGFIPGVRPGQNTVVYLTRIMNRLTLTGSFFLAFIAIMPLLFGTLAGLPKGMQVGGTSLLIVIGVALETMKTIESQLIKRHYKGFMNS